jgi:hypothetical protein
VALFPVRYRPATDAEVLSRLPLGESAFQAPPPDLIPEGAWLEVKSLFLQALERESHEWQEGNASLPLRLPWPLVGALRLLARPRVGLPQPPLRPAARPHRPARGSAGASRKRPRGGAGRRALGSRPHARDGGAGGAARAAGQAQRAALGRGGGALVLTRRGGAEAPARGDVAARALGALLPPRAQGGAHRGRPRRPAGRGPGRGRRGDRVPPRGKGRAAVMAPAIQSLDDTNVSR